jgi:hypothetical protein
MIQKINTKEVKNSCGGQGCYLLPDSRPYGYAYEAYEVECKKKGTKKKC